MTVYCDEKVVFEKVVSFEADISFLMKSVISSRIYELKVFTFLHHHLTKVVYTTDSSKKIHVEWQILGNEINFSLSSMSYELYEYKMQQRGWGFGIQESMIGIQYQLQTNMIH